MLGHRKHVVYQSWVLVLLIPPSPPALPSYPKPPSFLNWDCCISLLIVFYTYVLVLYSPALNSILTHSPTVDRMIFLKHKFHNIIPRPNSLRALHSLTLGWKLLPLAELYDPAPADLLNLISYFTALSPLMTAVCSFFFEWSVIVPQGLCAVCFVCLE